VWRKRDLSRFLNRPSADRWLLTEAVFWLALSRMAILLIPFRWTTRLFRLRQESASALTSPITPDTAARIGWAVRAASARTPWESACLAQSLAGTAMLRHRAIPAMVTLGVAKNSGVLTAHAWLSCGGVILTGAAGHEQFQVLTNLVLR
jgi:hypothetical protein